MIGIEAQSKKRGITYGLAMLIGFPLSLLLAFAYFFLDTNGYLVSWKSLSSPPSGAIHIVAANYYDILVDTNSGKQFHLAGSQYFIPNNPGWESFDESSVESFRTEVVERGISCKGLGNLNPLAASIRTSECVYVRSFAADSIGRHYFALKSNGEILYYGQPAVMGWTYLVVPILIPIAAIILISAIYLLLFIIIAIYKLFKTVQ